MDLFLFKAFNRIRQSEVAQIASRGAREEERQRRLLSLDCTYDKVVNFRFIPHQSWAS